MPTPIFITLIHARPSIYARARIRTSHECFLPLLASVLVAMPTSLHKPTPTRCFPASTNLSKPHVSSVSQHRDRARHAASQTVVIKKVTEKPPLELAGVDDIVLAIGERRSVRADAGVVALDWARPPPKTTAAAATDAAATDAAIESAPAEHNEAQPKA
eukprot:3895186-Pleurochrysis_carterae.AAC.1